MLTVTAKWLITSPASHPSLSRLTLLSTVESNRYAVKMSLCPRHFGSVLFAWSTGAHMINGYPVNHIKACGVFLQRLDDKCVREMPAW